MVGGAVTYHERDYCHLPEGAAGWKSISTAIFGSYRRIGDSAS